jgi:hypothetical protein
MVPEPEEQRAVILNVEDAEPTRFFRTRLFRSAGFTVLEAASAAGAYGCLGAPVSPEALVASINNALAGVGESDPSTAWLVTDQLGFILDASPEGAELLNGTVRGLHDRNLLIFFDKDRETWRAAVARAVSGDRVSLTGRLRPKERRPLTVGVEIVATSAWDMPALRWRLTRIPADCEQTV